MTFDVISFLGGLALIPIAAGFIWLAGAATARAWDTWEWLLRRLRPRRVPDWRNATLAAHVAEWPGKVRHLALPGLWLVLMTERPTGSDFNARRKATEARIRNGESELNVRLPRRPHASEESR